MVNPNFLGGDRFEQSIHFEAHRRMSGDERPFSALNPLEKLTRKIILNSITLPDEAQRVRDELTAFQSELEMHGLADM